MVEAAHGVLLTARWKSWLWIRALRLVLAFVLLLVCEEVADCMGYGRDFMLLSVAHLSRDFDLDTAEVSTLVLVAHTIFHTVFGNGIAVTFV